MSAPTPDDRELSRLLEAAGRDLQVDPSAKARARAEMLAAYHGVAADEDQSSRPIPADDRAAGMPELLRPRPGRSSPSGFSRRAAALVAVLAVVIGIVAVSTRDRGSVDVVTSASEPTVQQERADRETVEPEPTADEDDADAEAAAEGEADGPSEDDAVDDVNDAAAIEAALEIGMQFIEARASHDAEALVALLASDTTFSLTEFAQSIDDYSLALEWERLMGWQFLDPSCSAGSSNRVVCAYAAQDAFSERVGKGPYAGNSFTLDMVDGRIRTVTFNVNAADFFAEYEAQAFTWLRANHPDDFAVMLEGDRLLGGEFPSFPTLTADSLQLWELRVAEYLATQE